MIRVRGLNRTTGVLLAVLVVLAGCTSPSDETTTSQTTTSTSALPGSTTVAEAPFVGVAGAPGLGDPYNLSAGNGGYDVIHYELDLDLT